MSEPEQEPEQLGLGPRAVEKAEVIVFLQLVTSSPFGNIVYLITHFQSYFSKACF